MEDIKKYSQKLYLKPFAYNKVGIILSDLTRKKEIQQSLIESKLQNKIKKNETKIMQVIKNINQKFGEGKIRLSANSDYQFFNNKKHKKVNWQMRSEYRSACYTTSWYDIPKVKIK